MAGPIKSPASSFDSRAVRFKGPQVSRGPIQTDAPLASIVRPGSDRVRERARPRFCVAAVAFYTRALVRRQALPGDGDGPRERARRIMMIERGIEGKKGARRTHTHTQEVGDGEREEDAWGETHHPCDR